MFHTLSSKFRQMVILLALFAVVLPAQTESSFSGGDGTEASPYQISTVADLQQLATDINSGIPYTNKFFKLTKNLDLSSVCGKDVNGKEGAGLLLEHMESKQDTPLSKVISTAIITRSPTFTSIQKMTI